MLYFTTSILTICSLLDSIDHLNSQSTILCVTLYLIMLCFRVLVFIYIHTDTPYVPKSFSFCSFYTHRVRDVFNNHISLSRDEHTRFGYLKMHV